MENCSKLTNGILCFAGLIPSGSTILQSYEKKLTTYFIWANWATGIFQLFFYQADDE